MKTLVLSILSLCWLQATYAQDHTKTDKAVKRVQQFYNTQQNDSLFGMMSARMQELMPLDKAAVAMTQLHKQVGDINACTFYKQEQGIAYYNAAFANMDLLLIVALDSNDKLNTLRFAPKPAEKKEVENGATPITAMVEGGVLHGTLTMPEGTAKVPVVLIIAGSGPTDRDGNSTIGVTSNTYRMLADSFRKAGIACVRFDKRGVSESAAAMKSQTDMRFDDMVDDARAFVDMLNKDTRFSGVTIIGHSEGSLVGMLAAQRGGVKNYISVAGAGEPIDNIMKWQFSFMSEETSVRAGHIFDSLKKGYEVKKIDDDLYTYFKPSVQPYMRSWLKYDPAVELKKLKMPVMLVQGENDIQVTMDQVRLLKTAVPSAKLVVFHDMSHVLKDAPHDREQNYATYKNGNLPLSPGLAAALISFIKK